MSQETLLRNLQDLKRNLDLTRTTLPEGSELMNNFAILQANLYEHIDLVRSLSNLTENDKDQISKTIESLEDLFEEQLSNYIRKYAPGQTLAYPSIRRPDPKKLLCLELQVQNQYHDEVVTRVNQLSASDAHLWTLKKTLRAIDDEETKMTLYTSLQHHIERSNDLNKLNYYYHSDFFKEINQAGKEGRLFREQRDKENEAKDVYKFEPFAS
jgi:hypothetical protein